MGFIKYYHKEKKFMVQKIADCIEEKTGKAVICFQKLEGDFLFYVLEQELFNKEYSLCEDSMEKENVVDNTEKSRVSHGVEEGKTEKRDVKAALIDDFTDEVVVSSEATTEENEEMQQANPDLLRFLDAETYKEKIDLLRELQELNKLDERLLNNMAACMDLTIEDGRDGYSMIMSELEFRKKYEKDRLR